MRHASLVLALAFAFLSGACGGRGNTGNDDGGAQDANQFDMNVQQDAPSQSDVGPQRDAPPANYDSGQSLIQCGSGYCDIANGEECCITGTGGECQAAGTCAGYGTLLCDGPEDCFETTKPVCCGRISGTGGGTACDTAASCTGSAYRLCKTNSDCDSGQKCCGSVPVINAQYCLPDADCEAQNPTVGVPCGTGVTCAGTTADACCMGTTTGCMAAASCTQGVALMCDGPEDCQQDGGTAQVCCANVSTSGGGSVCGSTCTQTGLIYGILCHSDNDCVSPLTCKTLSVMGYSIRRCN